MQEIITQIAGWLPAVILPAAAYVQLVTLLKQKTARGVSTLSWAMFGFANLGLYVYTEKFFELQSVLSLLLTAVLDFAIIGVVLYYKKREKEDKSS